MGKGGYTRSFSGRTERPLWEAHWIHHVLRTRETQVSAPTGLAGRRCLQWNFELQSPVTPSLPPILLPLTALTERRKPDID